MGIEKLFLLFFCSVLGGSIALFTNIDKYKKILLPFIVSFSGAYLLSISIIHILPEIYMQDQMNIGPYILIGFFIQVLLEQFSSGIEHGHIHKPHKIHSSFAISIMLGISIHAILEGMPLGNEFHFEETRTSLLYGIAIHKIPAAFALGSILLFTNLKKPIIFLLIILFSLLTPFATYMTQELKMYEVLDMKALGIITGLVVGAFLHISTTILFESSSDSHHFSFTKILAIFAGAGLALLI